MLNRYTDHRILSRPVKVYWAGWETDTYRLQQAGWELSAEQCIEARSIRMIIRHNEIGMIGQTLTSEWDYERMLDYGRFRGNSYEEPERFLQMRHMGRHIVVHNHGPMDFRPIDAQPQLCTDEIKDLDDLAHFATPMVRTKALVLTDATVDQLLERALELQEPAKQAYFEAQIREKSGQLPPHRFAAQIISLKDAA